MRRVLAAVVLLLRFASSSVVSGVRTLLVILGPRRATPGFVRLRIAPMTEAGAALLGCLVTLTPGTTTIDVDAERGEMLLHLLDASDAEGAVRGIRADFERWVVVIFGTERT